MACLFHQRRFFVEFVLWSLLFGFFTTWFALFVVAIPIPTKLRPRMKGMLSGQI
jgi:hypothetical protein